MQYSGECQYLVNFCISETKDINQQYIQSVILSHPVHTRNNTVTNTVILAVKLFCKLSTFMILTRIKVLYSPSCVFLCLTKYQYQWSPISVSWYNETVSEYQSISRILEQSEQSHVSTVLILTQIVGSISNTTRYKSWGNHVV